MRQLRKRKNERKKPEQSFGQSMIRSWQSGRSMRREGGIETQCWTLRRHVEEGDGDEVDDDLWSDVDEDNAGNV